MQNYILAYQNGLLGCRIAMQEESVHQKQSPISLAANNSNPPTYKQTSIINDVRTLFADAYKKRNLWSESAIHCTLPEKKCSSCTQTLNVNHTYPRCPHKCNNKTFGATDIRAGHERTVERDVSNRGVAVTSTACDCDLLTQISLW